MSEEIRNNEEAVKEEHLEGVAGGFGLTQNVTCKICRHVNAVITGSLATAYCKKCNNPLVR